MGVLDKLLKAFMRQQKAKAKASAMRVIRELAAPGPTVRAAAAPARRVKRPAAVGPAIRVEGGGDFNFGVEDVEQLAMATVIGPPQKGGYDLLTWASIGAGRGGVVVRLKGRIVGRLSEEDAEDYLEETEDDLFGVRLIEVPAHVTGGEIKSGRDGEYVLDFEIGLDLEYPLIEVEGGPPAT